MIGAVRQVRGRSRDELAWRLRALARTGAQRLTTQVRPPRWDRHDIARALALTALPDDAQAALRRHDWTAAQQRLIEWLRTRRSRFVLNPSARDRVRQIVRSQWPDAEADAIRRAEHAIDGRFDLLGYRDLDFRTAAGAVDWHLDPVHGRRAPLQFWSRVPYLDPAWGDHKVIWELNRQQHWLALGRALWLTGNRRYARAIVRDLASWLTANPPLMGANWASMLELGFRSLSWLWGLHAILADGFADGAGEGSVDSVQDGPWLLDLLIGLDRQLTHVQQNLSRYFSPNTHLTGEALALYVAGTALPELAGSGRWLDEGRAILLQEIDRQIERDGGHVERSTHYHRYTLDFYLLALLTARQSGDLDAELRFTDAVERLAVFARAMADDSGCLPRIGDDDAGMLWPITGRDSADISDSLALAAALLGRPEWAPWGVTEEVVWLTAGLAEPICHGPAIKACPADQDAGNSPVDRSACGAGRDGRPVAASSRITSIFPDTGFVTTRTDEGDHLVMDAGPHGFLNGGHAHADALAVHLTLGHKPLLVDAGTPTYTMDRALRDHLRSSISHNTLTIDGRSASEPAGPFRWRTRTDAWLEIVRSNPQFSLIEAAHDGYGELVHQRVVLASPGGYVLVDVVSGTGEHEAALYWHFDPRWQLACETEQCLRATHDTGEAAWLVHDAAALWLVKGDDESQLGFVSPAYGARVPAWTARLSHRQQAPFAMVTWIGPARGHRLPHLQRLPIECDLPAVVVGARIAQGIEEWVTVVRPGAAAAGAYSTDAYHTDARTLQYAITGGRLTSLNATDISHALPLGDGLLALSVEGTMADLSLTRQADRLELWSTVPAGVRLQGRIVAGAKVISLNGRELRRPAGDIRETIEIASTDWGASTPEGEPGVAPAREPEDERSTENLEA